MIKIKNSLLLILVFSFLITYSQKRGVAYGHHSPNDMKALAPEISWWYNWSEVPESAVGGVFENYGFDFVPMTWNGNFNESKLRTYLASHPNTKYLLAFNEPNFLDQAKMTPSEAAAVWPVLEAIANDYNLKIVGPAVNYCGSCVTENGVTYTDPFKYLDDFFAACNNCRVDYIAVHSYMNTLSALSWYIGEFKKYGKPIWLTEFAGWEPNGNIKTAEDQINFMIGAVDFLEAEPAVFRYAWFIGRGGGSTTYPFIDLLAADGQLTDLGKVYKQMPVHNENLVVEIPALIEAEAYNKMSGILIQKTEDISGFANVGWMDAGDWLEYKIKVPNTQDYRISFRTAANSGGILKVFIDGTNLLTQVFTPTGGWQNWVTFENNLSLTDGEHSLRLQVSQGGFNLNWFKVGETSLGTEDFFDDAMGIKLYPNPGSDLLHFEMKEPVSCELRIMDVLGKTLVLRALDGSGSIDISGLKPGLYIVQIISDSGRLTRKLIIQG